MMFSDAHCDTISRVLDRGQALLENDGHVDLARLRAGNFHIQFFAAFIDPVYEPGSSLLRCMEIIDEFHRQTEKNNVPVILGKDDVARGGALLSVEGGSALCGRLSVLRLLHRLGVRALTLTWNGRNELADGVGEGERAGGLSSFGRQAVAEMNHLGMLVDVSHLSEKGFWDVAQCTRAPFIASHSNAKALCGHRRNLTDEQIREIIRIGGFIGINFCAGFLHEGGADITHILRHIDHILSLGGERVLGFGADFDGVDDLPRGVAGVQDMEAVVNALLRQNYSREVLDGIMHQNLSGVLRRVLL